MKPLMAAVILSALGGAAWADPLEGLWRTAPDLNGRIGSVRIAPCGTMLCGTLEAATDAAGRAVASSDIGRRVIWDAVPQGAGIYRGRVYSPGLGAQYDSRLILSGDSLRVEACLLDQCRGGEPWTRVD